MALGAASHHGWLYRNQLSLTRIVLNCSFLHVYQTPVEITIVLILSCSNHIEIAKNKSGPGQLIQFAAGQQESPSCQRKIGGHRR